MNAVVILLAGILILVIAYVTYGKWLAGQWGVDPGRKTPAHELEDGMDYLSGQGACIDGTSFLFDCRGRPD